MSVCFARDSNASMDQKVNRCSRPLDLSSIRPQLGQQDLCLSAMRDESDDARLRLGKSSAREELVLPPKHKQ